MLQGASEHNLAANIPLLLARKPGKALCAITDGAGPYPQRDNKSLAIAITCISSVPA